MSRRRPSAPSGADAPRGTVYLLHLSEPLAHAQHYVGWTVDLPRRIRQHRRGLSGARYMEVVQERGITFEVARTWENATRRDELSKKDRGRRHCPICQAAAKAEQ